MLDWVGAAESEPDVDADDGRGPRQAPHTGLPRTYIRTGIYMYQIYICVKLYMNAL